MKIQIASDLHIEVYNKYPIIEPKAKYLFLAGDIGEIGNEKYEEFLNYVNQHWEKVIMILGNHEYYSKDKSYEEKLIENREFFKQFENIYLLEKECIELEGYRIIGLTLWSKLVRNQAATKKVKKRENNKLTKIGIEGLNKIHELSKQWLINNYDKTRKTIIVTHYPLTLVDSFVRPKCYSHEPIEWLKEFANEYFLDIPEKQLICISGHTHFSHNFINIDLNKIQYLSNQLGYSSEKDYCGFNNDGVFYLKSM